VQLHLPLLPFSVFVLAIILIFILGFSFIFTIDFTCFNIRIRDRFSFYLVLSASLVLSNLECPDTN